MKSNLEILNDIMQPYYDKLEQISNEKNTKENDILDSKNKVSEMKKSRIQERRALEQELAELPTIRENAINDFKEKSSLVKELSELPIRRQNAIKDFKEKRDREINEYINQVLNSDSNFFYNYGSMVRRDLEREYDAKLESIKNNFDKQEQDLQRQYETELESLIKNFDSKEQELSSKVKELRSRHELEKVELEKIDQLSKTPNYHNVDLRELANLKGDLRKQLLAEQRRLNLELRKEQLNFDSVMLELSNFKYEYNEQNQVVNGFEFRNLYEKSNSSIDRQNQLKSDLKTLEEYLNMTVLTNEESASLMRSLAPWEQAEYDRRNRIKVNLDKIEVPVLKEEDILLLPAQIENEDMIDISSYSDVSKRFTLNDEDETEDVLDEVNKSDEQENVSKTEIDLNDIEEINDPINSEYEESNNEVFVNKQLDLFKMIFNEIVAETKNLKAVKINPSKGNLGQNGYYISAKEGNDEYEVIGTIENDDENTKMPCGENLNLSDIKEAIDNLYTKNKGRSFVVLENNKTYKMSKLGVLKLKRSLKKCITLKLVKENKISKLDLFRNFGKSKSDNIIKEIEMSSLLENNMPEGYYVSRNELITSLGKLFKRNRLVWLKNILEAIKPKKTEDQYEYEVYDDEEDIIVR